MYFVLVYSGGSTMSAETTVKAPIKDTPKEDRPLYKGQTKVLLYMQSAQNKTTSLQRTKCWVPSMSQLLEVPL